MSSNKILIDDTNKSFILHPSSFILHGKGLAVLLSAILSLLFCYKIKPIPISMSSGKILIDDTNKSFILHPSSFILKHILRILHFSVFPCMRNNLVLFPFFPFHNHHRVHIYRESLLIHTYQLPPQFLPLCRQHFHIIA